MKPSAYLVNTSRGEALDEGALYRALREKRIAGAALDSFTVEPLRDDSPLRGLDNVILTPHMVGHTKDVFASFPPAAVENITRILRGEPPLYCKNPEIIPAWKWRRESLIRLDARVPGDLRVLHQIRLHDFHVALGRRAYGRQAYRIEAIFHDLRIPQDPVDLDIQTIDDRPRRAGRGENAEPHVDRVARQRPRFGHGRHVGQERRAGFVGHRDARSCWT
jgi:hypothetical protein